MSRPARKGIPLQPHHARIQSTFVCLGWIMSGDILHNCFYKGTMLAAAAVGVLVARRGTPPPPQQLQIPSRGGTPPHAVALPRNRSTWKTDSMKIIHLLFTYRETNHLQREPENEVLYKNTDLCGKYHAEVTFSPKTWNDHTVTMVILPVALWSTHRRTCISPKIKQNVK